MKDLIAYLPNIHKEGYIFIAIFAIFAILMFSFSKIVGAICIILTVWCACFFRDPDRYAPVIEDVVLSPADGVVDAIVAASAPAELELGDEEFTRVSIFLSVFDVHVNRVPVAGVVTKLHYHPGQFISATLDKASVLNERQSVLVKTKSGRNVPFVQIAGLIARRIVCNLDQNQNVDAGQRYGIIRFGSRMDVYLPKGIVPKVYKGQRMVGGETVIAMLSGEQRDMVAGQIMN